jgi:hypothetical protein
MVLECNPEQHGSHNTDTNTNQTEFLSVTTAYIFHSYRALILLNNRPGKGQAVQTHWNQF